MFPGLYYLLFFAKADGTAALARQPVVLSANELKHLELRDRKVLTGLWERRCVLDRPLCKEKE